LFVLLSEALAAQGVITTIAGSDSSFNSDGKPAINAPIGYLNGVATDHAGNVYFTDPLEHLLLRVAPNGILSVIAGNGIAAYSGDGGPATSAAIAAADSPEQYVGVLFEDSLGGIVVDAQGNVYFGDSRRVRRVAPDGTITTVAGGGSQPADVPGLATNASLGIVNGLALDSAGNLYFCASNRVFKMTPSGMLAVFAGTGANGYSGDGGPAAAAQLSQPLGLAFDAQGNLYVADGDVSNFASRIRRITPPGTITTFAGGGTNAPASGLAPLTVDLTNASGVAVDSTGAVYVFAAYNGTLIKFFNGKSTLITSTTAAAFTTGVQAIDAYVVAQRPYDNSGIAFDQSGNLYVADSRDGRLCKIDATGLLTEVAGNGNYGFGGDGGPAVTALLQNPGKMTQTPDGTIYFVDALNQRVRAIAPNGIITTFISEANYPAIGILEHFGGIVSDPHGNVYVLFSHRLVELAPDASIVGYIIYGGGTSDSGAAYTAPIDNGSGLARDANGNFYVADSGANKIYKVTPAGIISKVAGNGNYQMSPDGATAAVSPVAAPSSLLADSQGGLYFEESPSGIIEGNVIRYITSVGLLKTIAGNGKGGFSDGVSAVQAGMMMEGGTGMVLDQSGNLYISDGFNFRVRMVGLNGIISTVAGNGTPASTGDGGLAKNASLIVPRGLLFDAAGDLLIADAAASRIRSVLAARPPVTVSPGQLSFSAQAGGAQTPAQELIITSNVSGVAFSVSKSAGANWVVLSATAGATPQIIKVSVNPSSLTPGSYQATLTIATPLATPPSTTVTVTIQVAPGAPPKMALDDAALSFTFPRNPTISLTQAVTVLNTGTGTLAFSLSVKSAGNWLSVSPSKGSVTPQTPATIMVTANPNSLAAGTYSGVVTVASSTTGGSATVLVTMTVSALDQAIWLSHTALSFTAVAGGGVIPPDTFAVTNIGNGNMNFSVSTRTLSGGQQWLSASPGSGVAPSGSPPPLVTVSVNQAGLSPGLYYGTVRVDSAGSANTPQLITIALLVLPANQDPGPQIEPTEIVFTAVQGAPPPGAATLLVYNVSGTPQTYFSNITAISADGQIDFSPGTAKLTLAQPTRLVVQPLTSTLPAGEYEDELTLQFSDGNLRRVALHIVVTPASGNTPAVVEDGVVSQAAAGCTPTQLVPALITLGQSFGIPAAWPVALKAQVLDDCGNPLNVGSVKVSFSNGDPPLSLQSVMGGMWSSTWVSGNTSGPVTLTVNASEPALNLFGTRQVTGGLGAPSAAPVLQSAVNGASFAANMPLAPGSLITLFGQDLSDGSASASGVPLGTLLAGATAVMAGNPLPLVFSSNGQINAAVSFGIVTNTSHQILVQRDNTLSVPIPVNVGPVEPAIFPYPAPGEPPNQGAIVNAVTYTVADPGMPVTAGDVLAIFCTGLGMVDQVVPDGTAAPASPLANTVAVPTVTIGGQAAQVAFSGLAPGFVGLYQIDVIVPSGVAAGNQVPVIVSISGSGSPAATIAVH